jgi:chaperonin GroEL (HSP60 family)
MKEAKPFVEEGVHPQVIIKSYRQASRLVSVMALHLPLLTPPAS